MTRAQFLNDLYRRLCGNGMSRDQAEQHLTYYAEMLADRMEEGMTEDEAVSGMEDLETIVHRILEEEGLPYRSEALTPPSYPDVTRLDGGGGGGDGGGGARRAYRTPKKWNRQRLAQVALWALAIVIALGAASHWAWMRNVRRYNHTSTSADTTSIIVEEAVPQAPQAPYADWYYEGEYNEAEAMEAPYDNGYEFQGGSMSIDDAASIKSIDIQWAAGTVYVQGWSQSSIWIQEYTRTPISDRTALYSEVADGEVTIQYRENTGLGIVKDEKWLMVLVPDGLLEELEIETTSANVQLIGLEQGELDVSTTSGYITLNGCYVHDAELSSLSGDIDLYGLYAEELDVSTTSGNIFGNMDCGDIKTSAVSGDITLYTEINTEKVQIETASGDIYLSITNPAFEAVNTNTVSGDVSLGLMDIGFTLQYDTVSGGLNTYYNMTSQNGEYFHNGGGSKIHVNTVSGDLDIF